MKKILFLAAAIAFSAWNHPVHAWEEECFEECCADNQFFVTAQYLLWSTDYSLPIGFKYVEGTSTTAGPVPDSTSTDRTVSGSFFQPHQKWSSGVKLGLGWEMGDEIDVRGYWTGYKNKTTKSVPTSQSVFIAGIINDISDDNFVGGSTFARGTYKLNYNIADLEVGKTFDVNWLLKFRPFIGLRAAWIHQDNILTFTGNTYSFGFATVDQPQSASIRNHTAGIGPRIGFETTWGDWYGFSLLGNFSASLVFAEPKTRFEFITTTAVLVTPSDIDIVKETLALNDDYWQLIPNFQVLLGVNWGTEFDCGNYRLDLFAAWESSFWWETSTIVVIHRGLGLQGLTTGVNFSF